MKRYIILIAVLFATAFSGFAQIEDEIQQSKKEKIAKGRAYLLEKFLERDYDKVKEIKDYLMGLESEDYVALTPFEQWHILQWTKEYDALMEILRHADSLYFASYNNKVFPEKDDLMRRLYLRGVEDKHLLKYNLDEAQLAAEDNAFLTLFLDWLVGSNGNIEQKNWNIEADKFLAGYPNSDYKWFVTHWIRKPYEVESDWGLGFGFDLCSGFTTGVLAKPVFGFGISLDVLYKRFDLTLGVDIMILKTRADQLYSFEGYHNLIYPKGSQCNWSIPYANLAYYVFNHKRIAIAPFVGIGGLLEWYPTNKNNENEYKDMEKNRLMYKAGLNFDIKTGGLDLDNGAFRIKYEFGLTGLKEGQVSTVHLISVGWSQFGRGHKRVYYE